LAIALRGDIFYLPKILGQGPISNYWNQLHELETYTDTQHKLASNHKPQHNVEIKAKSHGEGAHRGHA
jgi:hypothetical protein